MGASKCQDSTRTGNSERKTGHLELGARKGGRNMIALNILLGVVAFVCLLFIVGETKPPVSDKKREHITIAFVALVLLIIALNTIF